MKSTPGYSLMADYGPTNADIFKYSPETGMDPERVSVFRDMVYHRMLRLLKGNLEADPINVFIKPEPHKTEKIQSGRLRLISAVSLTDTMIDRVLLGWIQRVALQTVGATPCLVGWTPLRGGWKYIYRRFGDKPVMCLDKSSWDWTVQGYLVDMWKRVLKNLAVGHPPWWAALLDARFELLFQKAKFRFKDGTDVYQMVPGIMKSGCFMTLILNSLGQSLVHYIANLRIGYSPFYRQPVSVGDDTVQESFEGLEDYVRAMETTGAKVKGFKVTNWVEFCGFAFAEGTCIPAYWKKHMFKLQYESLEDKIMSYQILYANEPVMLNFCRRIAMALDAGLVLSQEEAGMVFNHPC